MDREQRRRQYLEAMGIRVWVRRCPDSDSVEVVPATRESGVDDSVSAGAVIAEDGPVTPVQSDDVRACPAAMDEPSRAQEIGRLDWDDLEFKVAKCKACALHGARTQTVFGVGSRSADWLIVGEAPGEQEDLKGEPFVGRAGQLLNEMLRAIGRAREEVYIANILKCRPPRNRDPEPAEAESCEPFLQRQVSLLNPGIIVAAGRIAAQNLLKTSTPIGKLRGTVHRYQGIPLIVTYHPAYLLRSPLEKRKAWDDLQLAVRTYQGQQPQQKDAHSSCSTGSIG